jgi:hypothetical protein
MFEMDVASWNLYQPIELTASLQKTIIFTVVCWLFQMAKQLHAQLFLLVLAAAVKSSTFSGSGKFLQIFPEIVCRGAEITGWSTVRSLSHDT